MKMVIDIPEGMLDELRICKFPIQDAYRLCAVIENGTPLPKGHGRLIDGDAMKTIKNIQSANFNAVELIRYWIDNQPTIIEADKEVDE